jgi:DnaJ family protein C protein 13
VIGKVCNFPDTYYYHKKIVCNEVCDENVLSCWQHPSLAVIKGAGLVMRAVIEEGEAEVAARMQDLALAEGALPCHLLTALFIHGTDGRVLTHRQLSRHLVGLWVTGHPTAMGLLKRIMVKSVKVDV